MTKKIDMIIKQLKLYLYILTGTFLIILTFYRRILLAHLPKELTFFDEFTTKYNLILLVIVSIISCCFLLRLCFYLLLNKVLPFNLLTKVGLKITNLIDNALLEVYHFIMVRVSNADEKVTYITNKFYSHFNTTPETYFVFLLYLIRMIVLLCFLVDIFIYFKFNYMYKAFYLLIISMCVKIMFYVLKDFASSLEQFKNMLIITDCSIDKETGLPITNYKFSKEYTNKGFDLTYYTNQFILCNKLTGYLNIYDRYSAFFMPYVNLFIYTLCLIGWIYILYKNISLL